MKILDLIAERTPEKYDLHERYLNAQHVRVLKTIGFDVSYTEARGPTSSTPQGNRYLDLLSGWGVFAVGRNHPKLIVECLRDVLHGGLPHLVQMDVTVLAGMLAERLLARMPPGLEQMFFCNSGTEAVEAAIKFGRYATRRSKLVFCEHGFHGLTLRLALAQRRRTSFREGFGPLLPDCVRIPFDDLRGARGRAARARRRGVLRRADRRPRRARSRATTTCRGAAALCRKYGTLLVADEVQTGLGRTGKFLAVEHWGVEPDLVLPGEGALGRLRAGRRGGVPASGCSTRSSTAWTAPSVHGSTFSKNNLAMAAGTRDARGDRRGAAGRERRDAWARRSSTTCARWSSASSS